MNDTPAENYYVVELFFDQAVEASVRGLWKQIGAVTTGADLAGGGSRPHISLASCRGLDISSFTSWLKETATLKSPFNIYFESVSTFFSAEGVVFLAPTMTEELMRLHRLTLEALDRCGAVIPELYRFGRLVPHCTLALKIPLAQVPDAVRCCQEYMPLPLSGQIKEIALVEISPTNDGTVLTFPLLGQSGAGR